MKTLPASLRFMALLLLATAGLALLVTAAGWMAGWRTATAFSNGLFIVGGVSCLIGAFSVLGGMYGRGDFKYQYTRTAGSMSMNERTQQTVSETLQGYRFSAITFLTGALLIVIAILIPTLFG
jgi:hypothetical protein